MIDVSIEKKDYEKVLFYTKEGLKIADKVDKANLKAFFSMHLGNYYQLKGDRKKAIKILTKAEKELAKIDDKRTLLICKDFLLTAKLGSPKKNEGLLYSNYKELRDTLYDQQMVEKIKGLNIKYETKKKEQEIVLLAKDKEIAQYEASKNKALAESEASRNKALWAIFSLLFLLISSIAYFLFLSLIHI